MNTVLGAASIYNLFILSDMKLRDAEIEGLTAVGGNSNRYLGKDTPVDFESERNYLEGLSDSLADLPANGTVSEYFQLVTLTGEETELNVFQLNASNVAGSGQSLDRITGINIVCPSRATVLINVLGEDIAFGNCRIYMNGDAATVAEARLLLWNFNQAMTWTNGKSDVYGSVLAPFADAAVTSGQISGNVIFDYLTGSIKLSNRLFEGSIPNSYCPPLASGTITLNTGAARKEESISIPKAAPLAKEVTIEQLLLEIMEAIVLEERGIAHMIEEEGKLIQNKLRLAESIEEVITINSSVESILSDLTKLETVLLSKLEAVARSLKEAEE